MRLHRVICLLWACLALTGCSALLEREYAPVEPHSSKVWESEAAGISGQSFPHGPDKFR